MASERKSFQIRFLGRLCQGMGVATGFTGLDWVKNQCREKLGFEPYPGTVNLTVKKQVLDEARRLAEGRGVRLVSPDPAFCDALCLQVLLRYGEETIKAAVVLPLVENYYKDTLELVAPVRVTETFKLIEGDELGVETLP